MLLLDDCADNRMKYCKNVIIFEFVEIQFFRITMYEKPEQSNDHGHVKRGDEDKKANASIHLVFSVLNLGI